MSMTVTPNWGITGEWLLESLKLFSQLDFNTICIGISWRNQKWPFFVVIGLLGVFTEDRLDPTAKDQLCDARKQK